MEVCQIFYDLSFTFFEAVRLNSLMFSIQFFGGLSVALWTNVLSVILLHVVVNTQSIDILKYYWFFCSITIGPALVIFVIYMVFYSDSDYDKAVFKTYYGLRLMSIIINFSVFALITYRANITRSMAPGSSTSAEMAIRVLSRRVVYYPLLQAITILPAVIYERLYGLYDGLDMKTDSQFALACLYLLFAPSAGMGYLSIFLVMQPNAYKHFMININDGLAWLNCCCRKDVRLEDDRQSRVVKVLDGGLTTSTGVRRLSGRFETNQRGDSSEVVVSIERFRSMEEDELVREINKRTDSTSSTSGIYSGRGSSSRGLQDSTGVLSSTRNILGHEPS